MRLGGHDVEITLVELRETDDSLLTDEEHVRAARFVLERDRIRFVASHAALHRILGNREIALTSSGKPYLVDGSLHFNLSHSGDYALIAVCATAPVGVDIEQQREHLSWRDLAMRFFTPREAASVRTPDDFYRLWVMKEAVLKAIGTGLSGGLATVEPVDGRAGEYDVALLEAPAGYSAAVAVRR